MTIALFFGSTTGNTEDIAEQIRDQFNNQMVDLFNIADEPLSLVASYDKLIFGIPTWDYGELQADWDDIWDEIHALDLTNKRFACFGCGDQVGYPEWYQDAMGLLHDKLVTLGGLPLGYWSTDGYTFSASKATTADGSHFVGLALDEDNQHELTSERIVGWCRQLEQEFIQ
jgi:flavodoxin II